MVTTVHTLMPMLGINHGKRKRKRKKRGEEEDKERACSKRMSPKKGGLCSNKSPFLSLFSLPFIFFLGSYWVLSDYATWSFRGLFLVLFTF